MSIEFRKQVSASETGTASEPLHDAHVGELEREHKQKFQKYLELAREQLSQLSSSDSVLYSPGRGNNFSAFFSLLTEWPTEAGDAKSIRWNVDEIRSVAKDGLKIYYEALKAHPPKEGELGAVAHQAREIANYYVGPQGINDNQPETFVSFISEEDYEKLNRLGEFEGHQSPEADRAMYLEAKKFISEL
ncbi:MAG: hypothetical protein Q8P23_01175 [bacterium]|nr:hypothetical protein [bacterium]